MALEKIDIRKRLLEYSISEFRTIPEYIAMCEAIAQGMGTVQDAVDYISNMIDLDSAEGVWLDFIGILVGTYRRHISENIEGDFFQVNAEDINREVEFYFPNKTSNSGSTSSALLNDNEFRSQIKAKIAFNIGKGTREGNINTIKAFTRADIVKITQESPMLLNIVIYGDNLVLTTDTYMKDTIEGLLANGISINDFEIYRLNIKWTEPKQVLTNYPILLNIAFGNNVYVIVSTNGYIITSTDGINISNSNKISDNHWYDVAFANGKFVVVGASGYITTSEDGINWTEPIRVGTNNWNAITYGNGKFVIVGGNKGYTSTSSDGIEWTTPKNDYGDTHTSYVWGWSDIVFANGIFVTVCDSSRYGFISTSENGIDWTPLQQISYMRYGETVYAILNGITFGNNKFVAIDENGYVISSTDGIEWTTPILNNNQEIGYWNDIAYDNNNNLFISVSGVTSYGDGEAYICTSSDGIEWNAPIKISKDTLSYNQALLSVYPSDNQILVIGNNGIITTSTDGITWSDFTRMGLGKWNGVAYGNDTFVAVGDSGKIVSDIDKTDYNLITKGSYNWNDITFGQGEFLAVGDGGRTVYSTNGTTWTDGATIGIGDATLYPHMAYGNNRYVAVGERGYATYSFDGENWVTPQIIINKSFRAITYGNNKFVAATVDGYILTTTDGVTWTEPIQISLDIENDADIIYANNQFVLVGDGASVSSSCVSEDGITWTPSEATGIYYRKVAYGNNIYVGVGGSYIATSTNGLDWTYQTRVSFSIKAITYGNGRFVIMGGNGSSTSTDGITWSDVVYTPVTTIVDIIYANDKFTAVGNKNNIGYILSSENGLSWTYTEINGTTYCTDIIYGNSKYIVACNPDNLFVTSTDSINWSEPKNMVITINKNYSIKYGDKFILTCSDGNIAYSTNGENWYIIQVGTNDWYSVAYGNNKYVAVGQNGYISSSVDGTTWTTPQKIGNNDWYGVDYGEGVFITVGDDGYISYSSDGETWVEPRQVGTPTLNAIEYGNGRFIAVGNNGYSITTVNGQKWLNASQVGTATWNGIAYGNNNFAVTSSGGYIMVSSENVNE